MGGIDPAALRGGGLFCRSERIKESKKLFDMSDFERTVDALADTNESEAAAVFLVSDIGADERADAGGIHVGNLREVDYQRFGLVGSDLGLKIKERGEDKWTGQAQDALSLLWAGQIFDDEGLLWHPVMLTPEAPGIVTAALILRGTGAGDRIRFIAWKRVDMLRSE